MSKQDDDLSSIVCESFGLSPKLLYDRISKTVVGQEEAKKVICNTVFLHFVRYCQSVREEKPMKKSNALLMGPTGCGKTFIVRETARAMKELTGYPICPVLEVDCTELSSRGWEGDNLSDIIKEHYQETGGNQATFDTTIVFLDEFDKLCKSAVGQGGTDHNRNTQYNILKMIEGSDLKIKGYGGGVPIGTHNLLFVLAGNFSEVRHARDLKDRTIGFGSVEADPDADFVDYHSELEAAGMATQLVGRVPYVGELGALQPEELSVILTDHLIPEYEDTWKFLNKELIIPKEDREIIVNNCYRRKTGARGLHADLAKFIENDLFNTEFKL